MLKIINADVLDGLARIEDNSVHCVVTSPPYWGLRDYSVDGQIGLEKTPELYVEKMVAVFREIRRVLRDDGTVWLNLGDSYAGSWGNYGGQNRGNGTQRTITNGSSVPNPAYDGLEKFIPPTANCGLKPKDLVGIPWRVAFALQSDGWWLRSDIIWSKPNPMPESVTDRPTKAHEYIFLLTKSERYFFDQDAVREPYQPASVERSKYALQDIRTGVVGTRWEMGPRDVPTREYPEMNQNGRNIRTVWEIATQPYPDAHFATFPEEIAKRCIMAGTSERGLVLDPFAGSGTVGAVALELGRRAILIELNPKYCELIERRTQVTYGLQLASA